MTEHRFATRGKSSFLQPNLAGRAIRKYVDDADVAQARLLVNRMRKNPPRLLILGDSMTTFVASYDTDRRLLSEMITDELGNADSTFTVAGVAWSSEMFAALLRLIEPLEARPVIMTTLSHRLRFAPWRLDPLFSRHRAVAALDSFDPKRSVHRMHTRSYPPTKQETAAFLERRYASLAGEMTIAEYRGKLADRDWKDADRNAHQAFKLAYHHTGVVDDLPESVEGQFQLGQAIAKFGAPSVLVDAPICGEVGERHLGRDFTARVDAGMARVHALTEEGMGAAMTTVDSLWAFGADDFIDPSDCTEHLNARGRVRFARMIAEKIAPLL